MKCQKCGHDNPQGEIYCQSCGEELKPAQAAPSPAVTTTPTPTPVPVSPTDVAAALGVVTSTGKKIATLKVGQEEYDLLEGATLVVARKDTDKCKPDIGLDDPTVSSTAINISGNPDGTITVEDTGTSTGFRIVKLYKPGEVATIAVGDMIMVGKQLIVIE